MRVNVPDGPLPELRGKTIDIRWAFYWRSPWFVRSYFVDDYETTIDGRPCRNRITVGDKIESGKNNLLLSTYRHHDGTRYRPGDLYAEILLERIKDLQARNPEAVSAAMSKLDIDPQEDPASWHRDNYWRLFCVLEGALPRDVLEGEVERIWKSANAIGWSDKNHNIWVYSSFPVWVPAYPLEETIKRLARIGYDGIEIALSSMLPAPGGRPGYNPASILAEERQETLDQYRQVIELCAQWGGKTVIYLAGWQIFGVSRAQAWEWSRECLVKVAGIAADNGVMMVIEPQAVDTNLIESCDDAIQIMNDIGLPNVKLMFDTIHAMYRSEVLTDYVYQMGANLRHLHLSDNDRCRRGRDAAILSRWCLRSGKSAMTAT